MLTTLSAENVVQLVARVKEWAWGEAKKRDVWLNCDKLQLQIYLRVASHRRDSFAHLIRTVNLTTYKSDCMTEKKTKTKLHTVRVWTIIIAYRTGSQLSNGIVEKDSSSNWKPINIANWETKLHPAINLFATYRHITNFLKFTSKVLRKVW